MSSLHIIYASTSGHTEYVCQVIAQRLSAKKNVTVTLEQVEDATEKSFSKADVTLLAASSWNTGGTEGQLNPHMFLLLNKKLKSIDLTGKRIAVVGCGDDRYRYTCQAADKLIEFIEQHGGALLGKELRVINEPYGQEDVIEKWCSSFFSLLKS